MSHAILSPSSAGTWLKCAPSARLQQTFEDKGSVYATEGTLAHSIGELLIKYALKRIRKGEYTRELRILQKHEMYSPSMLAYCEDYANHCMETYSRALTVCKDPVVTLEQRVDMTAFVPEGFGTNDFSVIASKVLYVRDLKYGVGVPVTAVDNSQLKLYAWGIYEAYGFMYDIDTINLGIVQPRLDSISEWEISVAALQQWIEEQVIEKAKQAYAGQGEFVAGKHCRFCKAKTVCAAYAAEQLEITKHQFADETLLSDEAVADILMRAEDFISWVKAVKDNALHQAINGKVWPGHKLVRGRSTRKITDEEAVVKILVTEGAVEQDIYKPKELQPLATLEGLIGKKKFTELTKKYFVKPQGAPTLVHESDPRAPIDKVSDLAAKFAED